jgi:transcriptional regulator with XRE-family HTH domain
LLNDIIDGSFPDVELPLKIRMLRDRHGLNNARLARLVGTTDQQVGRWCSGAYPPNLRQAVGLARVFGVSLDYLADDAQDEPPPPPPDVLEAPPTEVPVIPPTGPLDDACILKIAHELGLDEALRRLLGKESGPEKD